MMSLSTKDPFIDHAYVEASVDPLLAFRNRTTLRPSCPMPVTLTRPPYANRNDDPDCVFQTFIAV